MKATLAPGTVRGTRLALGETQAEFAQRVGASQSMVAAIEGGRRRPGVHLAVRIASVIDGVLAGEITGNYSTSRSTR